MATYINPTRETNLLKQLIFACSLAIGWVGILQAQPSSPPPIAEVGNTVLPTPTAAALGEYVDMPVSHHTGVPDIAIPIHTLTEGPLTVPVSVSYHAGGVRVATPASWVGQGWSLNAGGMISRATKGVMDDMYNGWYNRGVEAQLALENSEAGKQTFERIRVGTLDGEPDIFSFNFLNYTGKFIFDGSNVKRVVMLPDNDLIVAPIAEDLSGRFIGFKITTPDGTKYFFGVQSMTDKSSPILEWTDMEGTSSSINPHRFASTWYLRRIESADGLHEINLGYTNEIYTYLTAAGYLYTYHLISFLYTISPPYPYFPACPTVLGGQLHRFLNTVDSPVNNNYVNGFRLATITTTTDQIRFIAETERKDLISSAAHNRPTNLLDRIEIREGGAQSGFDGYLFCKKFNFNYDYWTGYLETGVYNGRDRVYDPTGVYRKRLRLNSIQEISCDDTTIIPPHEFEYYTFPTHDADYFPSRLTRRVDHWQRFSV